MEQFTISLDDDFKNLTDSISFTLAHAGMRGDDKFWSGVLGVAVGHMKLSGFPREEIVRMARFFYDAASAGIPVPIDEIGKLPS